MVFTVFSTSSIQLLLLTKGQYTDKDVGVPVLGAFTWSIVCFCTCNDSFRIWAILPETYCLWQLNNAHHCSLKKSMSLEITLFYGNDCTYLSTDTNTLPNCTAIGWNLSRGKIFFVLLLCTVTAERNQMVSTLVSMFLICKKDQSSI